MTHCQDLRVVEVVCSSLAGAHRVTPSHLPETPQGRYLRAFGPELDV